MAQTYSLLNSGLDSPIDRERATLILREDIPAHLSALPELDFSSDLVGDEMAGPWFRLAAYTIDSFKSRNSIEDVVMRQTMLVASGAFSDLYQELDAIGNVLHALGAPGGVQTHREGQTDYYYLPFHRFEFMSGHTAEPLVFVRDGSTEIELVVNPDLWLLLGLEERVPGSGIWWDPRRGIEALVRRSLDDDNLLAVEIQTPYLRKYLEARQMSLLVGHYRHLHLLNPDEKAVSAFVEEPVTLGSPESGVKAIFDNWGIRNDISLHAPPFLQRRLHLWFAVEPPELDAADPWADKPSFDPYDFTFPAREGATAPARFKHFARDDDREFSGVAVDFMTRVFFRQEVLMKYQGAANFEIADDGSVSCQHYWGVRRSTYRIGNELLATSIGDFAEGAPFEEWPHWQRYAVEPPSADTLKALAEETPIPQAVNSLADALEELDSTVARLAIALGFAEPLRVWDGSLRSLAGRQLKWVYPSGADDDEFLKRATLLSTFVIDCLNVPALRRILRSMGTGFDTTIESPPKPLGSRNLLQRLTLVAALVDRVSPDTNALCDLLCAAEGLQAVDDDILQQELTEILDQVRSMMAPLAFLYDLRTHGGLAHAPNPTRVAEAAKLLGLPDAGWHRRDFLALLESVTASIHRVSEIVEDAAFALVSR